MKKIVALLERIEASTRDTASVQRMILETLQSAPADRAASLSRYQTLSRTASEQVTGR